MTGAGFAALRAAPPAAHPAAGLRHPRARLRRRGHGDREPQPAAGQRLQGLPRRRQPDRAARRRGDRRADRGRRPLADVPRGAPGTRARRGHRGPLPRHGRRPRRRRPARPRTSSTRPCTASAAPRCSRCSRPPASPRRGRRAAGAAGPRLPDRRLPQPRGARARWTSRWRWPIGARRRPGDRQRPGRRPLRRGRTRPARVADAARGRGRRAARAPPDPPRPAPARTPPRSSPPRCSASMAAAAGQAYVETLTGFKWISRVARPGVRLRGGAGLLRRPRARPRQGRRLGAAAAVRAGGAGQGRGPRPHRPPRRPRARARPARHRPAVACGSTTLP